jgi:replicative DNA helicase
MPELSKERVLPGDINAEACVLSAMMIDATLVTRGAELLRTEQFGLKTHQILFDAMKELNEAGAEVDMITLIDILKKYRKLTTVGGEVFISELDDVVLSGANIDFHANIVKEKYKLRRLIEVSTRAVNDAFASDVDVDVVLTELESDVLKLSSNDAEGFENAMDIARLTLSNMNERIVSGVPAGQKIGLPALDDMLGGLRAGQLVIIASRPAHGKSSIALNIADRYIEENKKVGVVSLEMDREEVFMRMVSGTTSVDMNSMLNGKMTPDEISSTTDAFMRLSDASLFVDDSSMLNVHQLRGRAKKLHQQVGKLDVLIIDYMQLMGGDGKSKDRQQEISTISRWLKVLAKELKIPVIALSQLNRAVDSRNPPLPQLSDLRESGAIEQDADIVMFIFRPSAYSHLQGLVDIELAGKKYYDVDNIAVINVAKNRHGRTGIVPLKFVKEFTRFETYHEGIILGG